MFSLNPEINRGRFTVDEDCVLMAAVKEYGQNFNNFPQNLLPGRSAVQIRSRYNNVLKHVGKREHWSLEHDKHLMELVAKYGESDWARVSEEIRFHNRTSCRSRYTTIVKFLKKNPKNKVDDVPRRKRAFSTNVTADNWMETIIKEKHRDLVDDNDDENDFAYTRDRTYSSVTANVIGASYYKYFRYSYNFRFGERIIANENLFENLQIACQLLDAPSSRHRALPCDDFDGSFSDYVTCSAEVQRITLECDFANSLLHMARTGFTFPINLNTIIGLRAFVVLFEGNELVERKGPRDIHGHLLPSYTESATNRRARMNRRHPALEQFRRRFVSIFKNTAMLAKLTDLHGIKSGPRVKLKRAPRPNATSETATSSADDLISETIIICNDRSQQRIEELLTTTTTAGASTPIAGGSNDRFVAQGNDNNLNEWNVSDAPHSSQLTTLRSSPMDKYVETTQPNEAIAIEVDDCDYDYTLETNSGTYQIKVLTNATDDEMDFGPVKRVGDCLAFETPAKKQKEE